MIDGEAEEVDENWMAGRSSTSSSMDRLKDLLGDRPLKGIFTALGLPDKLGEKIGGAVIDTLDLTDCFWLMDLPEGLSRLINMRHLCLHLDWDRVTAFRSMPRGIDKLQSLQTLSRFVTVSKDGGTCNISELKSLKIRGELCILNLEAATGSAAREANLSGKEYLHKLMLKWSDNTYNDDNQLDLENSERVLEALCPHTSLKHLRIDNYPGRKLPSWVDRLLSLESLEIVSCPRLTQFSVETLRSLRSFRIDQCADLASTSQRLI
nr:unnamed protein product [Digitaria exilis]